MTTLVLAIIFFGTTLVCAQSERAKKAEDKVLVQEQIRINRAKKRKATQVANYMFQAQRRATLLERTAAITAWQERLAQQYEKDVSFGKYAHLYVVPAWPLAQQFFYSPVQLRAEYSFSRANRGFVSDGGLADIAELTFDGQPLVKDVLVASKLATSSDATPAAGYEFLADLANTPLVFSASHMRRELKLSYAISLWDNSLTIGGCMPLVERMRHIRVWPDLDSTARSQLRDRTADEDTGVVRNNVFRELYGIDVTTFFNDVLEQKGMRFDPHVHQFSVGDVDVFATASLFPRRMERWQVGLQFTIPVAKRTDERFFYPLELGNGGFVNMQAYTSLLGHRTKFGWPHAMGAITASFPATVTRRVPRKIVLSNVTALPETEVFGEELSFNAARDVDTSETTIPAFAQQTTTIGLRPGIKIDLRLGTVVLPFAVRGLQADLYYHFHVETADSLHKNLPEELWYTQSLLGQNYKSQHNLGVQLTYQPDAHMQLSLGLQGAVAGVNMPATWTATVSLSYQW